MRKEDRADSIRRGRPPKPAAEARSRRAVTFLTESEYSALADMARLNNMSISAFAHRLLSKSLGNCHK